MSNARFQRLKLKLNLEELREEIEKWSRLEALAMDNDENDFSDSESENTSIGSGSLSRGSASPIPRKVPSGDGGEDNDSIASRGGGGSGGGGNSSLPLKRRNRSPGMLSSVSKDSTDFSTARTRTKLPKIGVICEPPLTVSTAHACMYFLL